MTPDQTEAPAAPSSRTGRNARREPVVIDGEAVTASDDAASGQAEAARPPAEDAPSAEGHHVEPAVAETVATLEPAAPTPSPEVPIPTRRKRRFGPIIGLFVVLLAAAGGGVWAWLNPGVINGLLGDASPAIPSGGTSQAVTSVSTASTDASKDALAALDQRIARVESSLRERAPTPAVQAEALAALEKKIEERLSRLESAAREPGAAPVPLASPSREDITALEKRIEERLARLEAAPAPIAAERPDATTPSGAARPEALVEIEQRLAKLESVPPVPSATPEALAALDRKIEEKIVALAASIPQPTKPPPAIDLSPIETRIVALEAEAKALEAKLAEGKSEVRATQPPEATAPAKPDPAAMAAIAQVIGRAIELGEPFPRALSAAEALGASAEALAPLKAIAEKGAPAARALATRFSSEAKATLAAAAPPPPPDASIIDRLTASATSIVRVRPVGEAAGSDPAALVATIEAALAQGSLGDALSAWEKLPAPAREASRDFGEDARRRVAADKAVAGLMTGVIDGVLSRKDQK